jgi:hypothetical protein
LYCEVRGQRFAAQVRYQADDALFVGRLVDSENVVCFDGGSIDELEASFRTALDHYAPVPARGSRLAVLPPRMVAALSRACRPTGLGMNDRFVLALAVLLVVQAAIGFIDSTAGKRYLLNSMPAFDQMPIGTACQIAASLLAWLVWIARYRCRAPQDVSWPMVLRAATLLGLLSWLCPQVNSADLFLYVSHGRLMLLHHLSPYYHTYQDVNDDSWTQAWAQTRMAYGPANFPIMWLGAAISNWTVPSAWMDAASWSEPLAAWVANLNAIVAIYAIKALWLALHVLGVRLLWHTVPDHPLYRQRVFLYAVNPYVLFELICNGHIDMWMVFLTLAALYQARRERWEAAFSLGFLAALSKLMALALPLGLLCLMWHRRAYRSIARCLGVAVVIFGVLRLWVFDSLADMSVLVPQDGFNGTFPHMDCLSGWLWPGDPSPSALKADFMLIHWGLLWPVALAVCGAVLLDSKSFRRLVAGQLLVQASLLTVFASFVQPWYWVGLMLFGPFLPAGLFEYTAIMSLTGPFLAYYHTEVINQVSFLILGAVFLMWSRERWSVALVWVLAGFVCLYTAGDQTNVATCALDQLLPYLWLLGCWYRTRGARS